MYMHRRSLLNNREPEVGFRQLLHFFFHLHHTLTAWDLFEFDNTRKTGLFSTVGQLHPIYGALAYEEWHLDNTGFIRPRNLAPSVENIKILVRDAILTKFPSHLLHPNGCHTLFKFHVLSSLRSDVRLPPSDCFRWTRGLRTNTPWNEPRRKQEADWARQPVMHAQPRNG